MSFSGESLLYPVYGMRGGFSLDLDHEVCREIRRGHMTGLDFQDNSVTVVGWSRGEGEHGREVKIYHGHSSQGSYRHMMLGEALH